jgi:Leucine-rich repeat (LRR) protein
MEKLIFLLILVPFCVNAQIVNIPDANFKSKLLQANIDNQIAYGNGGYLKIDSNNDGEIQEIEAQIVDSLNVDNSNIDVLDGISSFINLKKLNCGDNNLTSINISEIPNLEVFWLWSNPIGSIDVSQNINIKDLRFGNNLLTSLDVSQNYNLQVLNCNNNSLTSLDLSQNLGLVYLECSGNSLLSIDVSQNINLEVLSCSSNQLSTLDLTNNLNLKELHCGYNVLTEIDVSQNIGLIKLYCPGSHVSNLNISQNTNLEDLECSNNQLNNLNLLNNINLMWLDCSYNPITTLDFSNNINLSNITCHFTLLTTIDVTQNPNVHAIFCTNNEFLTSAFIKNGIYKEILIEQNPNLQYICADEMQLEDPYLYVNPSVVVNSYCSFTPGGNYNTITGTTAFDSDNNGCDVNDLPKPNIKININDGTNQGATFTNNTGNYNFYTQAGSFDLTPNIENPSWFTFSPTSATIPFANNNNNIVNQDFCITANGIHPDVEIVIAPITPARPGFDAVYQIVYKNKGNQALSGNITFTYDDEVLDFVTASISPDTQSLGLLNWNYQNLQPFENRSIYVTLNVNSPQEIPAVNIGDVLGFQATITPVIGDELPEDNLFSYNQTVVGSYDPNDITCIEGEVVPPSEIGEYLHYIINFENTGTAEAENIVVKVEVDPTKFDIDSLQMLNTSHNAYIRQTGNKVEFIFQEIWLDTGGHGNVLLKIKSKNNLIEGDAVAKQANIYFDYNAPIDTNMANTTFEILSTGNFVMDESIVVFPNPTSSIVNINCNNSIKTVELYDVQGRLLQTQIVDSATTSLDISNKTNGIYFAKITSEKGVKVEKITKE